MLYVQSLELPKNFILLSGLLICHGSVRSQTFSQEDDDDDESEGRKRFVDKREGKERGKNM